MIVRSAIYTFFKFLNYRFANKCWEPHENSTTHISRTPSLNLTLQCNKTKLEKNRELKEINKSKLIKFENKNAEKENNNFS